MLQWKYLQPSLTAIVALLATILCLPANAQDHLANQRMLVAQAGSIGGTVGKTDKSVISNDTNQPSSTRHAKPVPAATRNANKEESLPKSIQMDDHALGMTFFITLHNVGGKNYEGTWSHGYATKFTIVAFTHDSIQMNRTDKPKFGAVTGSYSGSRSGNHATGQATVSNGAHSKWEASW